MFRPMGPQHTSKVVVAATIRFVDRATRDAAVAASVDIQRATRDDEPGCLAYCFAADPADDSAVQVYELWEDEATLAAHFGHPNYGAMRDLLRSFERGGPSIQRKFRCDAEAPVYTADGRPTSGFQSDAF